MKYILSILFLIPLFSYSQNCLEIKAPEGEFEFITQFAHFETGWYDEWLEFTNGQKLYPAGMPSLEKWEHPFMKYGWTAAMHEDSYASDVSNLQGPKMEDVEVQYFHVLLKGGYFSGMCPAYAFIDDSTMVTLAFGRASTVLLLLDIKDTIHVLDFMPVPGRGNSTLELAGKKGRSKIFSNTAGGAYFYLSGKDRIYIPGANNNILRVTLDGRKFIHDKVETINLKAQIENGNLVDKSLSDKDKLNLMTALMPDAEGNIWFTSRQGIVGLIHRDEKLPDGCPKVYATFIGLFGAVEKINRYFDQDFEDIGEIDVLNKYEEFGPEMRAEFREHFMMDKGTHEEIQNSFSVGKDGVYIVSNFALYKLRFNKEEKKIELDPKWAVAFKQGDLVYDNDQKIKPGHLNAGSGTTPTLMGDDYVIIGDNDTTRINVCVYSQETGELIFKHKLFDERGAAVENSMVAYNNSIVVGNTYGFVDPFKTNPTPGGLQRFDYNEQKGTFELLENWPRSGKYDPKTATPKLSAPNGMLYVYNRSDEDFDGHHDWQVTTIDFRTGYRVFYIKPFFNKGEFDDNIGLVMKWGSLGTKNYDRKVFNNIWGTFTFGPGNSFYIGAYRGFLRVSSEE